MSRARILTPSALPQTITTFIQSTTGRQILASLVALFLALVARRIVVRFLRRSERLSPAERLRWLGYSRSLNVVILGLGLVFIWGAELREFLVSLVVLASAIVLATKEMIMCVSGSVVRAGTRSFEVGDRIEIAGKRGDVIDLGLFGTTLLEIGPGHQRTGRMMVLPNSLFLSNPVANETFTDQYVLHTFGLPLEKVEGWEEAEAKLLALATEVCEEHVEPARLHMDAVSQRHGLGAFDVTPRVTLHAEDGIELRVRIPTPARERGRLEQEIVRRFFRERSEP